MKKNTYRRKNVESIIQCHSSLTPSDTTQLQFRPYQRRAFENRTNGIEIWLWARQTGKSYTLAAWAVDRLLTRPGRLVTVLSNSKANGMELNLRCAEVCHKLGYAFEQADLSVDKGRFETMNCETRIRVQGKVGRIKILAANPRTARGFSGDLILDEFAFHEDADAIWNAAEPILAANHDYLCRIASTPNGKHNLFHRMCLSEDLPVFKVTRTLAFEQGCPIYHQVTRKPIDPATARALAPNKRAYDQNYECVFEDESMALLTHELISAAEKRDVGVICENDWSSEAIAQLKAPAGGLAGKKTAQQWIDESFDPDGTFRTLLMDVCKGSCTRMEILLDSGYQVSLDEVFDEDQWRRDRDCGRHLFAGVDVGRERDRSVVTVVERIDRFYCVRAILRMERMRLPEQQVRLEQILNIPAVRVLKMDSTGIGLGLFEYTANKFPGRVEGVNFSSSVQLSSLNSFAASRVSGLGSARRTEVLATQLLQVYEDRAIHQPTDVVLREELRKPERMISPSGRVSIAATRDQSGHADHFWSLALAIDAAQTPIQPPFEWHAFVPKARLRTTTL